MADCMPKLTPKQQMFVKEYLVDLNGAAAARRAGYSEKNSDDLAAQLLRKTHVAAAIQAAMDKRASKVELTAERILEEVKHAAFLDPLDLFSDDGKLLPLKQMPEAARRAIAGIEVEEIWSGTGKDRVQIGVLKKIKLVSKEGTLTLAGRHLKMFTDKQELSGPNGSPVDVRIVL